MAGGHACPAPSLWLWLSVTACRLAVWGSWHLAAPCRAFSPRRPQIADRGRCTSDAAEWPKRGRRPEKEKIEKIQGSCGSAMQGRRKLWANHRTKVPGPLSKARQGLIGPRSGKLCRQGQPDLGEPGFLGRRRRRINLKHCPFLLVPCRAQPEPLNPSNYVTAGRDWPSLLTLCWPVDLWSMPRSLN